MIHINPEIDQPLPKAVSLHLGKLEDYVQRSPHRAPKILRRLRRNCDAAITSAASQGGYIASSSSKTREKSSDDASDKVGHIIIEEDEKEYNVALARIRLSLEAFISIIMLDSVQGDDAVVGIELFPILLRLMKFGTNSTAVPTSKGRNKNMHSILCRLGCNFAHLFIARLCDLTFADKIDETASLVRDIIDCESTTDDVLPEENENCRQAIKVFRMILKFSRRTGHMINKMNAIVERLLIWIEKISNSSSTITNITDERSHTKILLSPLPVSRSTAHADEIVNDTDKIEDQAGDTRGDNDLMEMREEIEAIQALRDLAQVSGDIQSGKESIIPLFDWLSGDLPSTSSNDSKWNEPVGAVIKSTVMSSYMEQEQGYSLVQLLLKHLVGKCKTRSLEGSIVHSCISEISYVAQIIDALDNELVTPVLLLLFKELTPILNCETFEKDTEEVLKMPFGKLQYTFMELFIHAASKVKEFCTLLRTFAGILSYAILRMKQQQAANTTVDRNDDIRLVSICMKRTIDGVVMGIFDSTNGSKSLDGKDIEAVLERFSDSFPLALSDEICRAFLTKTTIEAATSHQYSQQVAVLQFLQSCLKLTTANIRIQEHKKQQEKLSKQPSLVASILSPSKNLPTGEELSFNYGDGNVLSKHQLYSIASTIFRRLPTSSRCPAFIVAVDECYTLLLTTNFANIVLPILLPLAIAVQELALYGWDVQMESSSSTNTNTTLPQLRLLMLSFSMLRHIGKHYECQDLPSEAHPHRVKGLVDSENGIQLQTEKASTTSEEQDSNDGNDNRVLSLFIKEFENKGGVGSARDSVVNALLSKYSLSSIIEKAAKLEIASPFVPMKESWILQSTIERVEANPVSRSDTDDGDGIDVPMHEKSDEYGDDLPSVRDVLDEVLQIQPRKMSTGQGRTSSDDEERDNAIKAVNEALIAANIHIELTPLSTITNRS